MTEHLSKDQETLLVALARFPRGTNWYKLGRVVLGRLDSPGSWNDDLRGLKAGGYIVEQDVEGETLPQLDLTESGKALARSLIDTRRESRVRAS